MNSVAYLEHRAGSRLSKQEGESSFGLCDRLDRTRANSQRQLPTDHDYAVPTREYQTDQSSLITAQAAARSVLAGRRQLKQPHRFCGVDTVTPYQANPLIDTVPAGSSAVLTQCGLAHCTCHYSKSRASARTACNKRYQLTKAGLAWETAGPMLKFFERRKAAY